MSLVNHALTAIICNRLASDFRISAMPLDVQCSDGQVCLIGVAETATQKWLAIDLVSGVTGVHSVVDQITVRLPPGGNLTTTQSDATL